MKDVINELGPQLGRQLEQKAQALGVTPEQCALAIIIAWLTVTYQTAA